MRWEEALKKNQKWTAEQARNDLERLIITGERPADKVVGLACEALEKQIPKKPIDDRYPWSICPVCGGSMNLEHIQEYIQNEEPSHCEHCGQKIDWSDTE